MMSQNELVLARLRIGPVTALDALKELGVFRLAARVHDLREQGHQIHSFPARQNGKEFSRYMLVKEAR